MSEEKIKQKYYMHTVGGHPAFYDGRQICFAQHRNGAQSFNILTATTLDQIRKEQRSSTKWRHDQGWTEENNYGHIIVYAEEQPK